jgi:transcriptional antiterminator RfaH
VTVPPPGGSWFCARLRSRADFAVRDALAALSIETFCPTCQTETRWSDRTNLTTRPLFAGYIFAHFDRAARDLVLSTRGVVQILGINGPEPISDDVIRDLRRVCESPAPLSLCAYVAGESVRVRTGPFAGVEGVVSRVKGGAILTIPVAILGRSVSVSIDAADVEKL